MATLWSSDAKTSLEAGCRVKVSYFIDVETGTTPAYGTNVVDITEYVEKCSPIRRSSSVVNRDWRLPPVVLTVDNSDGYFTQNFVYMADIVTTHGTIDNVFRERPSGEAKPEECRVIIELTLTLADGSEETQIIHRGLIEGIKHKVGSKITAEITSQDLIIAKLKTVLDTLTDGKSDTDTL